MGYITDDTKTVWPDAANDPFDQDSPTAPEVTVVWEGDDLEEAQRFLADLGDDAAHHSLHGDGWSARELSDPESVPTSDQLTTEQPTVEQPAEGE